jgi:hypothetical protein
MAKKKKHRFKFKHRNAAGPPRPRAAKQEAETPGKRLAVTAAGAAGTALAGSFLARQGWAPKTIAGVLAAVGAGLAWKGEGSTVRSVGTGAMSAAGSQLALMMIDDRDRKTAPAPTTTAKKPSNADGLPAGALEAAFERARSRLELATDEVPLEIAA